MGFTAPWLHGHILQLPPTVKVSLLTWLMVGCTQPVWIAWMVAIASMPPAAHRQTRMVVWMLE